MLFAKVANRKLTKLQADRLRALRSHASHELAVICGGDRELELIVGRQFADQIAPRKEGPAYGRSVFINCPFDNRYQPLLHAATFTVVQCGCIPRCALEKEDASEPRFEKILDILEECQFGIHDLSRIELDHGFPRFNMPLELGVFLGAKRYGRGAQDRKSCLIFERNANEYDRYISDISGRDPVPHRNQPSRVVYAIRNWLAMGGKRKTIAGGHEVLQNYGKFKTWLPEKCASLRRKVKDLTWIEFVELVTEWSRTNPSASRC
jgi:hypothetical protein